MPKDKSVINCLDHEAKFIVTLCSEDLESETQH